LLVLVLICPPATASPAFPFALDFLGDSSLVASGLALYGSSVYFQSIKPAPQAAAIDSSNIPVFDRLYPATPSASLSSSGDYLSIGLAALPLALAYGRSGGEILDLGIVYFESLERAYSLDALSKSTIVRYRPYAYSTTVPADFSDPTVAASFPSANSSLAFAAATFGGYVFGELYPDSPARPWVWAGSLALATTVSVLLVAGGDHFASDAAAGAAIGAASGLLVPLLHERFKGGRESAVTLAPSGLLLVRL
jgi:membrane-associated phospholipid phosphatase